METIIKQLDKTKYKSIDRFSKKKNKTQTVVSLANFCQDNNTIKMEEDLRCTIY